MRFLVRWPFVNRNVSCIRYTRPPLNRWTSITILLSQTFKKKQKKRAKFQVSGDNYWLSRCSRTGKLKPRQAIYDHLQIKGNTNRFVDRLIDWPTSDGLGSFLRTFTVLKGSGVCFQRLLEWPLACHGPQNMTWRWPRWLVLDIEVVTVLHTESWMLKSNEIFLLLYMQITSSFFFFKSCFAVETAIRFPMVPSVCIS